MIVRARISEHSQKIVCFRHNRAAAHMNYSHKTCSRSSQNNLRTEKDQVPLPIKKMFLNDTFEERINEYFPKSSDTGTHSLV